MNVEIKVIEENEQNNNKSSSSISSDHKKRKERKQRKMIQLRKDEHKVKKYLLMETLCDV